MRKITCLLICLLGLVTQLVTAEDNPALYRPLGRFTLSGFDKVISPNGFFIADLQRENKPVQVDSSTLEEPTYPECEDDSPECEAAWESYFTAMDAYYNQSINYIYTVTLWDIRGGKRLWETTVEDRNWDTLVFSPDSSSLLIKTTLPYPNTEEVRLSFYETATGQVISETGNINPFEAPIIPGTLDQPLYAEPVYTADGAHVMVSYWRRAEESRCAVWEVATGQIIWEKESHCGTLSPDGKLTLIPQPHTNPYSDYAQVMVYDVISGEPMIQTEDEIRGFDWVADNQLILHRAYGDPPILWDISNDSRAVIEQPYQLGVFHPGALNRVMYYTTDQLIYIWDKANGALLGNTSLEGYICEQNDMVLVFEYVYTGDKTALVVRDLERDQELWRMDWDHVIIQVRDNGEQMLAYSYSTGLTEVINLDDGEIIGKFPLSYYDFYITPDWQWLVQEQGGRYIVWGVEDQLDLFADPPMAQTKAETPTYYEASTQFPGGQYRGGQYLWLSARSKDSQWVLVDEGWNNIWVPVEALDIFVAIERLPVYE